MTPDEHGIYDGRELARQFIGTAYRAPCPLRQRLLRLLGYLRCLNCGWVHFGVARPQPAPDRCFRCKRFAFEMIDEAELLRTVPRGVTLQGLRWPPIIRPPTIPKDMLQPTGG